MDVEGIINDEKNCSGNNRSDKEVEEGCV